MKRYLHVTVLLLLASVLGCGAAESSGVQKPDDTVIHPPSKLAEEFQLPKLKEEENRSFRRGTSKNYELVRAGKWREAGEHFGAHTSDLEMAAWSAYQANRMGTKDVADRDRYAFELLHFIFWHVNQLPYLMSGSTPWVDYARHYEALAETTKLPDGQEPLEMSHIELLEEAVRNYRNDQLTGIETRLRPALQKSPNSVPAILAWLFYHQQQQRSGSRPDLAETESLLSEAKSYGRLWLARLAVNEAWRGPDQRVARLIEEHWRVAPTDEERAGLLWRRAQLQLTPSRTPNSVEKQSSADSLQFYKMCYEQFPFTVAAALAREYAVQELMKSDRGAALALIDEQESLGSEHRGGLPQALLDLSTAWFEEDDLRSEELLQRLLRDYPDDSVASRALLGLSEVYVKRGQQAEAMQWLKRCVEFEQTEPTQRSIMDTENTRSVAIQRLASALERERGWKKALALWRHWRPSSWCGTCLGGMQEDRARHIVTCLAHMGDHADAAREALDFLREGRLSSGRHVAWQVYVLYRDADQLNDLKRMVAAAGNDNITIDQVNTLLNANSFPDEWGKERMPATNWPRPKTGSLPRELPPI